MLPALLTLHSLLQAAFRIRSRVWEDLMSGEMEGEWSNPDVPPSLSRRLTDQAVKVGTRTRLLVEIASSSPLTVVWLHDGKKVEEGERIKLINEGNFYCADISPVTMEDEGTWTCQGQNAGGLITSNAKLTLIVPRQYKEPEFVEPVRAVLSGAGTVSLETKVVGVPTPTLRWYKDGEEIRPGDVLGLSPDPKDPSLGTYTCVATNCMGSATSTSRLHVVSPSSTALQQQPTQDLGFSTSGPKPIFAKDLRNEKTKIGGTLNLECQVRVPPWPDRVSWYNSEGEVKEGPRAHLMEDGMGGYSIRVSPIHAADDGSWRFVATNRGGATSVSTSTVSVSYPKNYRKPKFLDSLKAVLTEEGLVSFECKVVGNPTPQLSWFKDGQELKPGDVYQLTGTNSLGSYCCIARNCMGEAESTAVLTVEDIQSQLTEEERLQLFSDRLPPKFIQGLKSSEAKISDPFTFAVKVSISPEPTILWFRDDEPVEESEARYKFEKDKLGLCSLNISRLEFVDQAEWKCVAMNDYGQSVTSSYLKLIIPRHYKKPKFLEELRAVLSDEGAVNLECKVIGVPQPVLKWFKDGKELKPGDIHRIISGQDGSCCLGTYTCMAQNCMGTVSSSASLLGFQDKSVTGPGKIVEKSNTCLRDTSLSTIQEERTSQLHDTDKSLTLDDRPEEVSFSFDGREVSVSLYETPDLTEEEALQIVEMYADQISEHVSEHNVVELPPMRFTKESSNSGKLLMEAMVIDVSPDYFTPVEVDDLRTDADLDEFSMVEEAMATPEEEKAEADFPVTPERRDSAARSRDNEKGVTQASRDERFKRKKKKSTDSEKEDDSLVEFERRKTEKRSFKERRRTESEMEDDSLYEFESRKAHAADKPKELTLEKEITSETGVDVHKSGETPSVFKTAELMSPINPDSKPSLTEAELTYNTAEDSAFDKSEISVLESLAHSLHQIQRGLATVEAQAISEAQEIKSPQVSVLESIAQPLADVQKSLEAMEERLDEGLLGYEVLETLVQPINEFKKNLQMIEDEQVLKRRASSIMESLAKPLQELEKEIAFIQEQSYPPARRYSSEERYAKTVEEVQETLTRIIERQESVPHDKKLLKTISVELQELEETASDDLEKYYDRLLSCGSEIRKKLNDEDNQEIIDVLRSIGDLVKPLKHLSAVTSKCISVIVKDYEEQGVPSAKLVESLVKPLEALRSSLDLLESVSGLKSHRAIRGVGIPLLYKLSVPMEELKTTIKLVENLSAHTAVEFLVPPLENLMKVVSKIDISSGGEGFLENLPVEGTRLLMNLEDSLGGIVNSISTIKSNIPNVERDTELIEKLPNVMKPMEDLQKNLKPIFEGINEDLSYDDVCELAQNLSKPLQSLRSELSILQHEIEIEQYGDISGEKFSPLSDLIVPLEVVQSSISSFHESVLCKEDPIHLRFVLYALKEMEGPFNSLSAKITQTKEAVMQGKVSLDPYPGIKNVIKVVRELRETSSLTKSDLPSIYNASSLLAEPLEIFEANLIDVLNKINHKEKEIENVNILKVLSEPLQELQSALLEIDALDLLNENDVSELKKSAEDLERSIETIQDKIFTSGDSNARDTDVSTLERLVKPLQTMRVHLSEVQRASVRNLIKTDRVLTDLRDVSKNIISVINVNKDGEGPLNGILQTLECAIDQLGVAAEAQTIQIGQGQQLDEARQNMSVALSAVASQLGEACAEADELSAKVEGEKRTSLVLIQDMVHDLKSAIESTVEVMEEKKSGIEQNLATASALEQLKSAMTEFSHSVSGVSDAQIETPKKSVSMDELKDYVVQLERDVNLVIDKISTTVDKKVAQPILDTILSDAKSVKRVVLNMAEERNLDESRIQYVLEKVKYIEIDLQELSKDTLKEEYSQLNEACKTAQAIVSMHDQLLQTSREECEKTQDEIIETLIENVKSLEYVVEKITKELPGTIDENEISKISQNLYILQENIISLKNEEEEVQDFSIKVKELVAPVKMIEEALHRVQVNNADMNEAVMAINKISNACQKANRDVSLKLEFEKLFSTEGISAAIDAPLIKSITEKVKHLNSEIKPIHDKDHHTKLTWFLDSLEESVIRLGENLEQNINKIDEPEVRKCLLEILEKMKSETLDIKFSDVEKAKEFKEALKNFENSIAEGQHKILPALQELLCPILNLHESVVCVDQRTIKRAESKYLDKCSKASNDLELGLMKLEKALITCEEMDLYVISKPLQFLVNHLESISRDPTFEYVEDDSNIAQLQAMAVYIGEISNSLIHLQEAISLPDKKEKIEPILLSISKPVRELRQNIALIQEQALMMNVESRESELEDLKEAISVVCKHVEDDESLRSLVGPVQVLKETLEAACSENLTPQEIEGPVKELKLALETVESEAQSLAEESATTTVAVPLLDLCHHVVQIIENRVMEGLGVGPDDTSLSDLATLASIEDVSDNLYYASPLTIDTKLGGHEENENQRGLYSEEMEKEKRLSEEKLSIPRSHAIKEETSSQLKTLDNDIITEDKMKNKAEKTPNEASKKEVDKVTVEEKKKGDGKQKAEIKELEEETLEVQKTEDEDKDRPKGNEQIKDKSNQTNQGGEKRKAEKEEIKKADVDNKEKQMQEEGECLLKKEKKEGDFKSDDAKKDDKQEIKKAEVNNKYGEEKVEGDGMKKGEGNKDLGTPQNENEKENVKADQMKQEYQKSELRNTEKEEKVKTEKAKSEDEQNKKGKLDKEKQENILGLEIQKKKDENKLEVEVETKNIERDENLSVRQDEKHILPEKKEQELTECELIKQKKKEKEEAIIADKNKEEPTNADKNKEECQKDTNATEKEAKLKLLEKEQKKEDQNERDFSNKEIGKKTDSNKKVNEKEEYKTEPKKQEKEKPQQVEKEVESNESQMNQLAANNERRELESDQKEEAPEVKKLHEEKYQEITKSEKDENVSALQKCSKKQNEINEGNIGKLHSLKMYNKQLESEINTAIESMSETISKFTAQPILESIIIDIKSISRVIEKLLLDKHLDQTRLKFINDKINFIESDLNFVCNDVIKVKNENLQAATKTMKTIVNLKLILDDAKEDEDGSTDLDRQYHMLKELLSDEEKNIKKQREEKEVRDKQQENKTEIKEEQKKVEELKKEEGEKPNAVEKKEGEKMRANKKRQDQVEEEEAQTKQEALLKNEQLEKIKVDNKKLGENMKDEEKNGEDQKVLMGEEQKKKQEEDKLKHGKKKQDKKSMAEEDKKAQKKDEQNKQEALKEKEEEKLTAEKKNQEGKLKIEEKLHEEEGKIQKEKEQNKQGVLKKKEGEENLDTKKKKQEQKLQVEEKKQEEEQARKEEQNKPGALKKDEEVKIKDEKNKQEGKLKPEEMKQEEKEEETQQEEHKTQEALKNTEEQEKLKVKKKNKGETLEIKEDDGQQEEEDKKQEALKQKEEEEKLKPEKKIQEEKLKAEEKKNEEEEKARKEDYNKQETLKKKEEEEKLKAEKKEKEEKLEAEEKKHEEEEKVQKKEERKKQEALKKKEEEKKVKAEKKKEDEKLKVEEKKHEEEETARKEEHKKLEASTKKEAEEKGKTETKMQEEHLKAEEEKREEEKKVQKEEEKKEEALKKKKEEEKLKTEKKTQEEKLMADKNKQEEEKARKKEEDKMQETLKKKKEEEKEGREKKKQEEKLKPEEKKGEEEEKDILKKGEEEEKLKAEEKQEEKLKADKKKQAEERECKEEEHKKQEALKKKEEEEKVKNEKKKHEEESKGEKKKHEEEENPRKEGEQTKQEILKKEEEEEKLTAETKKQGEKVKAEEKKSEEEEKAREEQEKKQEALKKKEEKEKLKAEKKKQEEKVKEEEKKREEEKARKEEEKKQEAFKKKEEEEKLKAEKKKEQEEKLKAEKKKEEEEKLKAEKKKEEEEKLTAEKKKQEEKVKAEEKKREEEEEKSRKEEEQKKEALKKKEEEEKLKAEKKKEEEEKLKAEKKKEEEEKLTAEKKKQEEKVKAEEKKREEEEKARKEKEQKQEALKKKEEEEKLKAEKKKEEEEKLKAEKKKEEEEKLKAEKKKQEEKVKAEEKKRAEEEEKSKKEEEQKKEALKKKEEEEKIKAEKKKEEEEKLKAEKKKEEEEKLKAEKKKQEEKVKAEEKKREEEEKARKEKEQKQEALKKKEEEEKLKAEKKKEEEEKLKAEKKKEEEEKLKAEKKKEEEEKLKAEKKKEEEEKLKAEKKKEEEEKLKAEKKKQEEKVKAEEKKREEEKEKARKEEEKEEEEKLKAEKKKQEEKVKAKEKKREEDTARKEEEQKQEALKKKEEEEKIKAEKKKQEEKVKAEVKKCAEEEEKARKEEGQKKEALKKKEEEEKLKAEKKKEEEEKLNAEKKKEEEEELKAEKKKQEEKVKAEEKKREEEEEKARKEEEQKKEALKKKGEEEKLKAEKKKEEEEKLKAEKKKEEEEKLKAEKKKEEEEKLKAEKKNEEEEKLKAEKKKQEEKVKAEEKKREEEEKARKEEAQKQEALKKKEEEEKLKAEKKKQEEKVKAEEKKRADEEEKARKEEEQMKETLKKKEEEEKLKAEKKKEEEEKLKAEKKKEEEEKLKAEKKKEEEENLKAEKKKEEEENLKAEKKKEEEEKVKAEKKKQDEKVKAEENKRKEEEKARKEEEEKLEALKKKKEEEKLKAEIKSEEEKLMPDVKMQEDDENALKKGEQKKEEALKKKEEEKLEVDKKKQEGKLKVEERKREEEDNVLKKGDQKKHKGLKKKEEEKLKDDDAEVIKQKDNDNMKQRANKELKGNGGEEKLKADKKKLTEKSTADVMKQDQNENKFMQKEAQQQRQDEEKNRSGKQKQELEQEFQDIKSAKEVMVEMPDEHKNHISEKRGFISGFGANLKRIENSESPSTLDRCDHFRNHESDSQVTSDNQSSHSVGDVIIDGGYGQEYSATVDSYVRNTLPARKYVIEELSLSTPSLRDSLEDLHDEKRQLSRLRTSQASKFLSKSGVDLSQEYSPRNYLTREDYSKKDFSTIHSAEYITRHYVVDSGSTALDALKRKVDKSWRRFNKHLSSEQFMYGNRTDDVSKDYLTASSDHLSRRDKSTERLAIFTEDFSPLAQSRRYTRRRSASPLPSFISSHSTGDLSGARQRSRSKSRYDYLERQPYICTTLRDKRVEHGANVKLTCNIGGEPEPTVQWRKDGQLIESIIDRFIMEYSYGVASLEIKNVIASDAGQYTCVAINSAGQAATTATLRVNTEHWQGIDKYGLSQELSLPLRIPERSPRITGLIGDSLVPAGGVIALHLQVEGCPRAEVTWLKEGAPVRYGTRTHTFFDHSMGLHTLLVEGATLAEGGMYHCKVLSGVYHLHEPAPALIQVVERRPGDKPALITARPETRINLTAGEDLTLTCYVSGEPKPRVMLMKGLRDITEGGRTLKECFGEYTRLTLKRALPEDSGTYFIVARNPYGTDRAFSTVKIRERTRSLTPTRRDGSSSLLRESSVFSTSSHLSSLSYL